METPQPSINTDYDPLNSLESEVERFMQTNLFTPMEVTGFYIQARCVISELRELRKENEYLRKVRERQVEIIRNNDVEIIKIEEQSISDIAAEQARLDTLIKYGFVVHEDEHSKFAVFCPNIGDYITSWLSSPRNAIDAAIQKLNSD